MLFVIFFEMVIFIVSKKVISNYSFQFLPVLGADLMIGTPFLCPVADGQ